MDAKITKKRLGEYLSYEWLKVVAFAVVIIVVWSLIFSVTSTKLTMDQVFTVFNYRGTIVGQDFEKYPTLLMSKNSLSYETNEVSIVDVTVNNNAMAGSLLETRIMAGEGDVIYVADSAYDGQVKYRLDEQGRLIPKVDEQGQPVLEANGEQAYETETSTYLYDFLSSRYFGTVMPLEDVVVDFGYGERTIEGILTVTSRYLSEYFVQYGDFFDAVPMDETKMEEDFRARVAETKDKRFRNEALIESGLKQEKERLHQYREAYNAFVKNLADGKITRTVSTLVLSDDEGKPFTVKGSFSLNLNPAGQMNSLDAAVYYYKKDTNGKDVKTTENINLVFLNLPGSREEFVGEKLVFVNYLMNRHYGK